VELDSSSIMLFAALRREARGVGWLVEDEVAGDV
jgi:hypothetical protein